MTDLTILDLGAIVLEDGAARGITQTLEPIEAATSLRRTVNGSLVNLAAAQFRKYKSVISGNDQIPPALDDIWPGDQITVECISELGYTGSGGPAKSVVTGSSRTEGTTTFYRPSLSMRVVRIATRTDEWGAVVGWSIELEEV